MIFKLKKGVGKHTQNNADGIPIVYKAGDVIESDSDLARNFANKFERIDVPTDSPAPELAPGIPMSSVLAKATLASDVPVKRKKKDVKVNVTKAKKSLGEDITSQYTIPKGKKIKIFTNGGGWCTIRINDDSKTDEKLRTNAIQAWIDIVA